MFTTMVAWILKHHADMSYARWTDVLRAKKDELIDRVRCSSTVNFVDFYKEVCFSNKNGRFITETIEENFTQMVDKLSDIAPEEQTTEATASVFREVLGKRAGYGRGLGETVIPQFTKVTQFERKKQHAETVERHQKEAEYYKQQFEDFRGHVMSLLEGQDETDKFMNTYISSRQS